MTRAHFIGYVIHSGEHARYLDGPWWRVRALGYTPAFHEAGVFSEAELQRFALGYDDVVLCVWRPAPLIPVLL